MTVPRPLNDCERLEALYRYQVLDTAPEEAFNRLTKRAAELLEAPVSVISLVDRDRQWIKSCYGLPGKQFETPRDDAFCAHTILEDEPLIVVDATADERFSESSLVVGEPNIRFYVGVPLATSEGFRLGALCVFGPEARPAPTPEKLLAFRELAAEVCDQLEFLKARKQLQVLSRALEERKREFEAQEVSLQRAETLAGLALETGRLGYWQRNLQTDETVWSPGMYDLMGHSAMEPALPFKSVIERVHPEDQAAFIAKTEVLMMSGLLDDLEYRVVHPDGKVRWLAARGKLTVSADGRPQFASGVVWDFTDKRLAEEEIRRSGEFFKALNFACPVGIFRADREGGIEYMNRRLIEICGLEREALGFEFYRYIHDEDRERMFNEYRKAIAAAREYEGDCRLARPDGSVRWAHMRVVLVPGNTKHPTYVIGTIEDVTGPYLASEELRQAKNEAEKADRAKGEFLANMSHEIRTPLNGVLATVSLLADTELTEEQEELVDIAKSSGEALLHLLTDLLDLSKAETGMLTIERAPFDLKRTVYECADLFRPKAETKGLTLQVSYASELETDFVGDAARIRQIILNYLSNAVKFTDIGTIGISVAPVDPRMDTPDVRIAIWDTGIGIPKAAQSGLFGRFMQVDSSSTRRFGGSGLGLSICKQLGELMGGSVGFETEAERGSRFWVDLPLLMPAMIASNL